MDGYKIKSEVCLTPGQCYPVNTEVPFWMLIILAGSTVLLINEIVKSLNS